MYNVRRICLKSKCITFYVYIKMLRFSRSNISSLKVFDLLYTNLVEIVFEKMF